MGPAARAASVRPTGRTIPDPVSLPGCQLFGPEGVLTGQQATFTGKEA
jgi:hypothetical protein